MEAGAGAGLGDLRRGTSFAVGNGLSPSGVGVVLVAAAGSGGGTGAGGWGIGPIEHTFATIASTECFVLHSLSQPKSSLKTFRLVIPFE